MQKEIQMVHVMFLAIETGGIVTTLLAFFFLYHAHGTGRTTRLLTALQSKGNLKMKSIQWAKKKYWINIFGVGMGLIATVLQIHARTRSGQMVFIWGQKPWLANDDGLELDKNGNTMANEANNMRSLIRSTEHTPYSCIFAATEKTAKDRQSQRTPLWELPAFSVLEGGVLYENGNRGSCPCLHEYNFWT